MTYFAALRVLRSTISVPPSPRARRSTSQQPAQKSERPLLLPTTGGRALGDGRHGSRRILRMKMSSCARCRGIPPRPPPTPALSARVKSWSPRSPSGASVHRPAAAPPSPRHRPFEGVDASAARGREGRRSWGFEGRERGGREGRRSWGRRGECAVRKTYGTPFRSVYRPCMVREMLLLSTHTQPQTGWATVSGWGRVWVQILG